MMTYGLLRGGKKFGVLVGVLIILTFFFILFYLNFRSFENNLYLCHVVL